MIYLDNSATSLVKPPQVAAAAALAINTLGNPGRGSYECAAEAGRRIYAARHTLAGLVQAADPLNIAFTSGATESLNLVLGTLLSPGDGVITSVLEHNSVLRPLYKTGCKLSFMDCDDTGALDTEKLEGMVDADTRMLVLSHGSNLIGSIADLALFKRFCRRYGLLFVLDVAQTLGNIPVDAGYADILCFSGHKGLLGPQGTGGVIAVKNIPAKLYKTGGTGTDSFSPHQPLAMPDMLEAGTPNLPGICGLQAGAAFVAETGLGNIVGKETELTARFLEGVLDIPGITLYGSASPLGRLPVVALNVAGLDSEEVSRRLWEEHSIATRPGGHCAPLAHQRFGTQNRGMVRFSFGYYNTVAEIDTALKALAQLAKEAR